MTKSKRQISIRTVLLLVVPISIGFFFFAEFQDANSAISELEDLGATVFINDTSLFKSLVAPKSRDMDIRIRVDSRTRSQIVKLLNKFGGSLRLQVDMASEGSEFFSELEMASHIRELEVENAVDEITSSLAELQSLRKLTIHGADFSGKNLGKLSALNHMTFLDLSKTQIDDATLAKLHEVTSLEELDVSFTKITDFGLASLKCFQLKSLSLAKTRITSDSMEALSVFSKLSQLNIDCENISLDEISKIRHLPLVELTVSFVELDAQGKPTIAVYFPECEIRYDGAYQQPDDTYQEKVESFPLDEIQKLLNKKRGTQLIDGA